MDSKSTNKNGSKQKILQGNNYTIDNNGNVTPTVQNYPSSSMSAQLNLCATTTSTHSRPRILKLGNHSGVMKLKKLREARCSLIDHNYSTVYNHNSTTPRTKNSSFPSTITTSSFTTTSNTNPSDSPVINIPSLSTPVASTLSCNATVVVNKPLPSTLLNDVNPTVVCHDPTPFTLVAPTTADPASYYALPSTSISNNPISSAPSISSLTPPPPVSPIQSNPLQLQACNQHSESTTIENQLNNITNEIKSLRQGQEFLLATFEYGMATAGSHAPLSNFKINQMRTREELIEFNLQLANPDYLAKVLNFIRTETGDYRNTYFMHRAIDILFTPELMAACSWSGVGNPNPKIQFKSFSCILELFSILGATSGAKLPMYKVQEFFQCKFNHAKRRLTTYTQLRQSAPRSFRRTNRIILQDMANKEQKF